jgi:Ca-activated chloride channel family protein
MFRFENTSAFFYLWSLPILVFLFVVFSHQAQKKLHKFLGSRLTPFLTSSVSPNKRRWKLALQCLVLLFFVLALARPQMGESKQEVRSEGVELMLVVDVSESMLAEDVRPNRLEQAKTELAKLIEMMPGNKIGIIAFAGSATLMSPLTTDPTSLRMYLDSLSPLSVSSQGTEFKQALTEAEQAFKRGGVDVTDTVKVTRVILIASDGEDHEPGALDQAQKLAKEGMKIFSLAYGTEKGAPIPEKDGMGFLRGYKKDKSGQTILTTVKGEALQALAQAGEGSFYHASFGGNHIQKVVEDIGKLEKTEFESEIATQYEERFQLFVLIGIVIALLELFLGDRSPASRLWKGRFEVAEGGRG